MTVVAGHDGSDSGDEAAALGARLARATGESLLVVTVYPEENPIGVGRVDAEWVAAMREHAAEGSEGAARARRRGAGGGGGGARRGLGPLSPPSESRVHGSGSAAHGLNDVAEGTDAS